MTVRRFDLVIVRNNREKMRLDTVAARARLHPALIEKYLDCGLLEPIEWEGANPLFDMSVIPRLRIIERLRRDLSINLAGIAIILDMVERLRSLQSENDLLRSRL
jgi:MerR family transcriptional regulator/heat shock protein HspR